MSEEQAEAHPQASADGGTLQEIRAQRIAKLEAFRAAGADPYPAGPFPKTSTAEALQLDEDAPATIVGRIMLLRTMGNVAFGQLQDESGQMQFMVSKRELEVDPQTPDLTYKFWMKHLDIGDFICVEGVRTTTRTGEPTVAARRLTLVAKSLLPLPDKHHGLRDEEELLRKRYLDILLHRDVQEMIYRKARFWRAIRNFLQSRGFTEVQTPVLEHTTGGADARPFVTHHNYFDMDVCLRISMGELWQKRLLVAGLEKVFEIGRQFRNENQSREHLNDYEQLEFYWAYANYELGMQMVEELFRHAIQEAFGTLKFTMHRHGNVHEVDLAQPWERYDYVETVQRLTGVHVLEATDDELRARIDELEIDVDAKQFNRARGVDALWKWCRRQLTGPGFLVNEPLVVSPLAKRKAGSEGIVERFHVLIAGSELGNGYSELNDPLDQAERFSEQQQLRDRGDDEAQMADWEFVEALEYGMPPALGFGMSERVFAFFMDRSVRECQIFPFTRPLSKDGSR